jgi:DNA-binding CsgD family transcriptional regulator
MALLARKELRALLIKLYHFGRGDSASELAERLGLSRRQVENIINDSGQMSHKRAGVLLAFTAGALEMNGDVRGTFSDDAQVVAKRLELAQDDEALRGRLFATLDMLETWVNTGSPNGAGPPSPKLHAVP